MNRDRLTVDPLYPVPECFLILAKTLLCLLVPRISLLLHHRHRGSARGGSELLAALEMAALNIVRVLVVDSFVFISIHVVCVPLALQLQSLYRCIYTPEAHVASVGAASRLPPIYFCFSFLCNFSFRCAVRHLHSHTMIYTEINEVTRCVVVQVLTRQRADISPNGREFEPLSRRAGLFRAPIHGLRGRNFLLQNR